MNFPRDSGGSENGDFFTRGTIFRIFEVSFQFGMNFPGDSRGSGNGDFCTRGKRSNFPDFRSFIPFRDEFPREFERLSENGDLYPGVNGKQPSWDSFRLVMVVMLLMVMVTAVVVMVAVMVW